LACCLRRKQREWYWGPMVASVSQVGIHLKSNISTGHTTHTGVCRAR